MAHSINSHSGENSTDRHVCEQCASHVPRVQFPQLNLSDP